MKNHLLSYLTQSKTPVKKQELLNYLRSMGFEVKERVLRLEIKKLVAEGHAIGMSESGYFMATNEEQHEQVKVYTKKKIYGLWRFYNDFDKAFCKLKPERQLTLFNEMI